MATTKSIIAHHLKSFGEGDLKGLLSDYAPEAVMFTANGPLQGVDEIRPLFQAIIAKFSKPGAAFRLREQFVEDMEGNVWEWTQDRLGDLSGGAVIDPQGPPSNPIGWKVVRGGSYDFAQTDSRSARRFFFGNHPALNDSDLGFRVVLAIDPR
jgi:hypothetical protein